MRFRIMPPNLEQTSRGPRLFDPIRKQLVPDGPEERVRQSVLWSLVHVYGYPVASLASEELVQRGTDNRDRADILVRVPRAASRGRFSLRPADGRAVEWPLYSARVAALSTSMGGFAAGFSPIPIPDEIDVTIDGVPIRCRTIGFTMNAQGHGLALQPLAAIDGLPPIIGLQVTGYGRTPIETRLAQQLGIPENLWNLEDSVSLAAWMAGDNLDLRLGLKETVLASSPTEAQLLLFADPTHFWGVLVVMDVAAMSSQQNQVRAGVPTKACLLTSHPLSKCWPARLT